MNSNFFEMMLKKYDNVEPFLIRQKSAATIALMGPTSSAKSTLITELLPPESNKLLSRNIGDTAQTTLIPTRLMLNSGFRENEIFVSCKIKPKRSSFPDFRESLVEVMTDTIYEMRDEIEDKYNNETEDFNLEYDVAEKVLNPINRAFHVFQFAYDNNDLAFKLLQIMEEMMSYVSYVPGLINDEADKLYKELRKSKVTAKKREAYEQIIDARMGKMTNRNLIEWYDKLEGAVLKSLEHLWIGNEEEKSKRMFLANLNPDDEFNEIYPDFIYDWEKRESAEKLMDLLYSKDSPYSLVFDEIIYATRPSESFINVFSKDYPDRIVKINILDTVGLTQSSQDAEIISQNMDNIIKRGSDALLFLCAADEQPLVYDTCINLLNGKKQALSSKIVVVCRTKSDIVVENIMHNKWKRDHGTNTITKNSLEEYAMEAVKAYTEEHIEDVALGEKELGHENNSKVEFISLRANSLSEINPYLYDRLGTGKIFKILFDIVKRVDSMYLRENDFWLQSKELADYPVSVAFTGQHLIKTIAMALVTSNSRNGNQYTQYISVKNSYGNSIQYHGRSVNCFRRKLSYGEGHETNAYYYGNFRLHITAMVNRWLKETIPPELLADFGVDFRNLATELSKGRLEKFVIDFDKTLVSNWDGIIYKCAKALSYDYLAKDFEECYSRGDSWSDSFRNSLTVLNTKFSNENYWKFLYQCLILFSNELLRKLYIFD